MYSRSSSRTLFETPLPVRSALPPRSLLAPPSALSALRRAETDYSTRWQTLSTESERLSLPWMLFTHSSELVRCPFHCSPILTHTSVR